MIVECDDAPAHTCDSIYAGGNLVGTVTSGGFGHRVGKNIAMGFIDAARAEPGTELEIGILGSRCRARVFTEPIFDPANERVRG